MQTQLIQSIPIDDNTQQSKVVVNEVSFQEVMDDLVLHPITSPIIPRKDIEIDSIGNTIVTDTVNLSNHKKQLLAEEEDIPKKVIQSNIGMYITMICIILYCLFIV
jgi:hypothetical protein